MLVIAGEMHFIEQDMYDFYHWNRAARVAERAQQKAAETARIEAEAAADLQKQREENEERARRMAEKKAQQEREKQERLAAARAAAAGASNGAAEEEEMTLPADADLSLF